MQKQNYKNLGCNKLFVFSVITIFIVIRFWYQIYMISHSIDINNNFTINIFCFFQIWMFEYFFHSEVGGQLWGSPKWSFWPIFEVSLRSFWVAISTQLCQYIEWLNFSAKVFFSTFICCWLNKCFHILDIENIESSNRFNRAKEGNTTQTKQFGVLWQPKGSPQTNHANKMLCVYRIGVQIQPRWSTSSIRITYWYNIKQSSIYSWWSM